MDPPIQWCPKCGLPWAERLISACTFRLKGRGWTPNATRAHGKDGNPHGM